MQTALGSLFGPGVGWENSFEAPELHRFYFMLQPSSINVFLKHLAVKQLGGGNLQMTKQNPSMAFLSRYRKKCLLLVIRPVII